uniref:Uncharacterized protein n=1 Tax=Anopheles merus TaxID=30066 RepID=A0A182UWG0_ANOME
MDRSRSIGSNRGPFVWVVMNAVASPSDRASCNLGRVDGCACSATKLHFTLMINRSLMIDSDEATIETRVHAPGVPFMSPVDEGEEKEKEQALGEGNVENPQGLGFPSRGRRRTQYDRSPFMVSSVAKG